MTLEKLKKTFSKIKGKTIALVYAFQGDANDAWSHHKALFCPIGICFISIIWMISCRRPWPS